MAAKVATALERLNLDDTTPQTYVSDFKYKTLEFLWTTDNPDKLESIPKTKSSDPKKISPTKKNFFSKNILTAIEEAGAKVAIESFKLALAEKLLEPAKIDHKDNTPRLRVLKKRLFEQFRDNGVSEYLKTHFSEDRVVLSAVCDQLEIAHTDKDTCKTLIENIVNEVNALGIEAYFYSFNITTLEQVCEHEKIEVRSRSRDALVQAILTRKPQDPVERQARHQVPKKIQEPSSIKKGVNFYQLYEFYNLEDLREWCRDHNLIHGGKKKVVIERILGFLDGDKENVRKAPLPRRAARRSKAATAKQTPAAKPVKKVTKKATPPKDDKPKEEETTKVTPPKDDKPKEEDKPKKVTPPKDDKPKEVVKPKDEKPTEAEPMEEDDAEEEVAEEEVAEEEGEEEAVEEGEAEEGDELDLDNLSQYTVAVLKQYCELEELPVKGTTKEAYIKAIDEYNASEEAEAGED